MSLNLDGRPESLPLAIAHLQRAVALDPSFSVAWAGLSTVYANGAFVVPAGAEEWRRLEHGSARARPCADARRAACSARDGIAEARRGHWLEAAHLYERLQASYAQYGMADQAWGPRGVFLLSVGRVREAIRCARTRASGGAFGARVRRLSQSGPPGRRQSRRGVRGSRSGSAARRARYDPFAGMGLVIALSGQDRVEIDRRLRCMRERCRCFASHRKLGAVHGCAGRRGGGDPSPRLNGEPFREGTAR